MTFDIPLSVLDLVPVGTGTDTSSALQQTLDLAQHAERWDYHRYWVAEHHNMPGIASSAPAVLIGSLAAATERIRVGSGGVMLPNHPPLTVAEQFGMLQALYPDRIDLGIGRAPGTDPVTARALRRSQSPLSAEDFPQQLSELEGYFSGLGAEQEPAANALGAIQAVPAAGNRPPIWLLGSSGFSAQLAGMLGMPFSFAHHFAAENTLPALRAYRESFRPSALLAEPYAMVCAAAICAEDEQRARQLALPGGLQFLKLRSGSPERLPTPEEARDYPYSPAEWDFVQARLASQFIGDPDSVARQLADLAQRTDADELMLTAMVQPHSERLRSFQLIADTLSPRVVASAG